MAKLTDILGTKYIYLTFNGALTKYILDNPTAEIDLAGARITKDCMQTITSMGINAGRCYFVDTEDAERNRILEYNQQQYVINKQFRDGTIRVQPLPIPDCAEDVDKYLAKDYGDIHWNLGKEGRAADLWACLLQARRPDVKFYTIGQLERIFNTICEFYRPRKLVGQAVNYVNGMGQLIHLDAATQDDVESFNCVSDKFGQANLFKEPDWQEPLKRMVRAFELTIVPRTHHIEEYL